MSLGLIGRLPGYSLARLLQTRPPMPINYTLGLTYRCNSRCKTCNIHSQPKVGELTLNEWTRIFRSIGKSPYWVTFSGGEPFLRDDIILLHDRLCSICNPKIINIPTNGLLTDKIVDSVWEMALRHQEVRVVINLSIDHYLADKNDEIRGVNGAFEKSTKTYRELSKLNLHNLCVGIHTVISKFNVDEFPQICNGLTKLNPTQYITEIAEERKELCTVGSDITPKVEDYENAINYLVTKMNQWKGLSRLTRAFRLQYYQNVVKTLKLRRQIIPCYAGYTSCQISPDGNVVFCCIKYDSIGNLGDVDYDFRRLWYSAKANNMRKQVRNNGCYCPMANVSYTNMLMHPPTLLKILRSM